VLRIKPKLRHFAVAGAVALSACASPQLLDSMTQADGSSARADASDSSARSPSRSTWQSSFLVAPATNRSPAKSEFISRGSGQFVGTSEAVAPAKTFKGSDGVTINLLNAPIAQAAKTIVPIVNQIRL